MKRNASIKTCLAATGFLITPFIAVDRFYVERRDESIRIIAGEFGFNSSVPLLKHNTFCTKISKEYREGDVAQQHKPSRQKILFAQTLQESKINKDIIGKEHYTRSNGLKIYLWEKYHKDFEKTFEQSGKIVLLVHGKTWSGRPDFDLQIRDYSLMDFLARNGYDVWSIDIHGYGKSEKTDKDWSDTESAANDIGAAVDYISGQKGVGKISILGWSWGAQITGLYTMNHPEKVSKIILYAMGWKGRPSSRSAPMPTEQYRINNEAAARSDFIAGQYEPDVVEKYVKEVLAADPKSPNGVVVDQITKFPILKPELLKVPTLIIHPEKDFLANEAETLEFFAKLGTTYKAYIALPDGGHAILLEKNHKKFQAAVLGYLNQP
ncbi:alpha/beta fold hydrolase [Hymenobacter sp.]|uniref:alpha/beta hydrolase n=1 Tax=Hymenobacter sp. TaxID=1898978 RepID=UPI00286CED0E|nr:alpha/beta fold hydrolase [Hymenobacter sp.]